MYHLKEIPLSVTNEQTLIQLPNDTKFTLFTFKNGKPVLFALLNTKREFKQFKLQVFPVGVEIPAGARHIATVVSPDGQGFALMQL